MWRVSSISGWIALWRPLVLSYQRLSKPLAIVSQRSSASFNILECTNLWQSWCHCSAPYRPTVRSGSGRSYRDCVSVRQNAKSWDPYGLLKCPRGYWLSVNIPLTFASSQTDLTHLYQLHTESCWLWRTMCTFGTLRRSALPVGPILLSGSLLLGVCVLHISRHRAPHWRPLPVAHNLGSETKRATGIPMFMAIGQCGSVLGSHIFPATEGPTYMWVYWQSKLPRVLNSHYPLRKGFASQWRQVSQKWLTDGLLKT